MEQTPHRENQNTKIRPASSLLAIRDGREGLEVLILKRSANLRFLPGFLSFPGGSIDDEDFSMAHEVDVQPPLNHQEPDDLAYAIGALRESTEEVGVTFCLLRSERSGQTAVQSLVLTQEDQQDLLNNRVTFQGLLDSGDWRIAGEAMRFVGRWVTPPTMPARFDTRFFVTVVEERDLSIRINPGESVWGEWWRPERALEAIQAKQERAAPPTVAMLRGLAAYDDVQECFAQLDVPSPDPDELAALADQLKKSK